MKQFLGIFLLLLVACGGQETAVSTLPLESCRLAGSIEARCGTLTVFEDQQVASGRTIPLNIAVIPASGGSPRPDPLFLLAGGPGQSAVEAFPLVVSTWNGITADRDIVLVDQRGTGKSNPLACENFQEVETNNTLTTEELVALAGVCRAELEADLTLYTTEIAMADLDAVRAALGYEQINLFGVSYGTRAALTYLRLYPERVRTVVLDAVVSNELVLYQDMPADGQRALQLLFARCAADADCQEQFPDLASEFQTLLDRLAEPVAVTVAHPVNGELIELELTQEMLTQAIFNLLYSPEFVSLLPLLIHTVYESGDFAPLVSQALLLSEGVGLYQGMFYSVACAEDAPLISLSEAAQDQENTVFPLMAELFVGVCEEWPRGVVSADFRQPVTSETPVLLLSGEADPVTPPVYAEQVAQGLPNSLHLVIPGYGHGVSSVGCMPRVVADFIERGTTADLDISCLSQIQPLPFFVTLAGPKP